MKRRSIETKRDAGWWRGVIERQRRTGEPVREVCEREGIATQTFYWHRRKLEGSAKPSFTAVEVGLVNEVEIRLSNGRSVVVRGAVSPDVLRTTLHVAEGGQR